MEPIAGGAGARLLEQSTDLSIEVRGSTLPQLFDMAALATVALQCLPLPADADERQRGPLRAALAALGPAEPARELDLSGQDTGALLVHWLRELSYLLESEGLAYTGARFQELGPGLSALVTGVRTTVPPLRELKGVTYHELVVNPVGDEWLARISFDL